MWKLQNGLSVIVAKTEQAPPRFELGLLDSESRVLAITPWSQFRMSLGPMIEVFWFDHSTKVRVARMSVPTEWDEGSVTSVPGHDCPSATAVGGADKWPPTDDSGRHRSQ